ncbi:1929_t:CDS:2 [Rhizophagus irregularis]|nr:1929_t:CDS:2 [Rhizophagus irregularis]
MSTTALTEETLQLQMLLDGFFKKNTIWSLIEKISEVYITSGQRSKKRCYEDKIEKESLGYINDVIDDSIKDSKDDENVFIRKFYFFLNIQDHMEDSQGHKESYKPNSDLHTPVPSKKAIRLMYHSTNTLLSLTPSNLYNKIMNLPTLSSQFCRSMTRSAIQEEKKHISKSVESFLEALLLSEIVSLRLLVKECGAREELLDVTDRNTIKDHLENVDVNGEMH